MLQYALSDFGRFCGSCFGPKGHLKIVVTSSGINYLPCQYTKRTILLIKIFKFITTYVTQQKCALHLHLICTKKCKLCIKYGALVLNLLFKFVH